VDVPSSSTDRTVTPSPTRPLGSKGVIDAVASTPVLRKPSSTLPVRWACRTCRALTDARCRTDPCSTP